MSDRSVHSRALLSTVQAVKFLACSLWLFFGLACEERKPGSHTATAGSFSSLGAGKPARQADLSRRGLIVVLGSSTAAGIGPKDPKNAWVVRYRRYLAAQFPNVSLVNLAVGGQTTFEIQPTGYVPPANRPSPVPGKNITAALALNPRAIIVNLPSNDQAGRYPIAEQLANYDRVANLANAAHVLLWVSTPQPRDFDDSTQIDALMTMRDLTLQKFAPRSLDFWTPFAAPNGFIKASYNAGDGTHLNDAAHAILAEIVQSARIPERFSTALERSTDE